MAFLLAGSAPAHLSISLHGRTLFFGGGADVSDVNARDRLIAWPPVLLRPAFSGSTHQNHFKLSTPDLLLSPLNETTADRPRVRQRAACSDYLIHRDIFHSAK